MNTLDSLIDAAIRQNFSGWDFSYLKGRWQEDSPPWSYEQIIHEKLNSAQVLLDMGTGGGEFLATLAPLPASTVATEAYLPNVPVAHKRLNPFGVHVVAISETGGLPFGNAQFDLIINRHEYFDPIQVYRILKPGGYFITQQVGGANDIRLNALITGDIPPITFYLSEETAKLKDAGFTIERSAESFPELRFLDVGAIVYYLKVIEWQIPNFDVEIYRESLKRIHQMIQKDGHLAVQGHRFLIIAQK